MGYVLRCKCASHASCTGVELRHSLLHAHPHTRTITARLLKHPNGLVLSNNKAQRIATECIRIYVVRVLELHFRR